MCSIRTVFVLSTAVRCPLSAAASRARKLAQREEQEMIACTFRPNVPRQSLAAGPAAIRVTRTPGTDSQPKSSKDGGDSGGDGAGGDGAGGDGAGGGGGGGEGGERFSTDVPRSAPDCRLSGAGDWKGDAPVRPSSRKSLDGTAAAQRLFEETGRLDERRFEGQERKRMWEEEVYARTCTFEVTEHCIQNVCCKHIPRGCSLAEFSEIAHTFFVLSWRVYYIPRYVTARLPSWTTFVATAIGPFGRPA